MNACSLTLKFLPTLTSGKSALIMIFLAVGKLQPSASATSFVLKNLICASVFYLR